MNEATDGDVEGRQLTVLSGPSGVGKSSVVDEVRAHHPQVWVSVSVTTRAPRPGEQPGVVYHFVDGDRFRQMVDAGELLEHARYAGSWYGTPAAPLREQLAAGRPVLLEVELQGARQVRRRVPGARLVFLAPPSWEELERRLSGRGTEDPAAVRRRLDRARIELAAEDEFDEVLVNSSVRETAARLVALMTI